MIRIFSLITVLTLFVGCAATTERREAQNLAQAKKASKAFEFDGHCGMGLCRKKDRVPCDPTITVEYKTKNYCFSTEEARDTFLRDIDKNIRMANENWAAFGGGMSR